MSNGNLGDGRDVSRQDIKQMGSPPQQKPGSEAEMDPSPKPVPDGYRAAGKVIGKVALVSGGDSGIGRSAAVLLAMEGADVGIIYHESDDDAKETQRLVQEAGRKCLLHKGDIGDESFCRDAVAKTRRELGGLQILVNNAAEQHPQEDITKVTAEQLERTFRTNFFGYFFLTKHAVPHLTEGDSIINVCSVTAFKGMPVLLDYSATKGAIVAFTRSLAEGLKEKKIRVNSVAPGPVWTPLIPSTFPPEKVEKFGDKTIWERPAEPGEIGTSIVFLASADSNFFTGQTLHPNGGTIVAG